MGSRIFSRYELHFGGETVKTLHGRTDHSWIFVVCLVLMGSLSASVPSHGQSVFLKEAGAITTSRTSSGDLTTQVDSYLGQVTQQFSKKRECSGISLVQGNRASFTVQYFAAFLLDQRFVNFVVIDKKGTVLRTRTDHSIEAFVTEACEVIKEYKSERRLPTVERLSSTIR